MTLTTAQAAKVAADEAAIAAEVAAFEEANRRTAPETQEENLARATAYRMPGGAMPDGLVITENVDGREQVINKSRGNALRQIGCGVSRWTGRAVKD